MRQTEPDRPFAFAAVVGDVVASKRHPARRALHEALAAALTVTNETVRPSQPLTMTVGDEFQGAYPDLGSAIHAAFLVRLHLFGQVEVRFGIGWGPVEIFDAEKLPFGQDGPAWWSAREAIDLIKNISGQQEAPRGWTTACAIAADAVGEPPSGAGVGLVPTPADASAGDGSAGALTAYLNAFLICRDELLARMNETHAQVLRGLLEGNRQADIAQALGVTQSAVSQTSRNSGAFAILHAHRAILGESEWLHSVSG